MTRERSGDVAAYLNGLGTEDAVAELLRCCASARWARLMAAARPYVDARDLERRAEETWRDLEPEDWLEAFAAHPRIGDRAGGWSSTEQSGMDAASQRLRQRMREANAEYERRFGHVFLVCATGLSAEELATRLAERLDNDAATELRTAAAEQAKITRLRLRKLRPD